MLGLPPKLKIVVRLSKGASMIDNEQYIVANVRSPAQRKTEIVQLAMDGEMSYDIAYWLINSLGLCHE